MDKKGVFLPSLMIIILSILTFLLIVTTTGKGAIERSNIEEYLEKQKTIFTKEQELEIEKFVKGKGIPIEIVQYLNTSKEIKKLTDELVLNIYDFHANDRDIKYVEEEIVYKIKEEVELFEKKFYNIDVWKYLEKPTREIVTKVGDMYEKEISAPVRVAFTVFSKTTIIILLIVIVLCALPLLISRKIWGLFYISIPGLISSLSSHYILKDVINSNIISGITIPNEIIDNVRNIANDIVIKVFAISITLLVIFILYFIIKFIAHKINVRIKAKKM